MQSLQSHHMARNSGRTALFIAALGALTLNATTARAVTITTADGSGADTYVFQDMRNEGQPGDTEDEANFGADANPTLAKWLDLSSFWSHKGYLRFDLSSASLPAAITGATLTLDLIANNAPGPVDVFGLNDLFAGTDNSSPADGDMSDDEDIHGQLWPEGVIDWLSAPGNDVNSPTGLAATAVTPLGSWDITDGADGPRDFSSAALTAFINADTDGLVTLIFTIDQPGGNVQFESKEKTLDADTVHPTLTLVPEPVSVALLGLGGGVMMGLRRRA